MKKMDHINWDRLRVFEAVAKAGSISASTSQISITQSAASRQIKSLEDALGVDLFYRTSRGLQLTQQGEALYNTVSNFKSTLADTRETLFQDTESVQGKLVITCTLDLGSTWLASSLTRFHKKYPGLDIEILLSERKLALHKREADVAIQYGRSKHPEMHNRYLMNLSWGIFAHSDYLLSSPALTAPDDLRNHRLISYSARLPHSNEHALWHEHLARQHGCRDHNIIRINNVQGMHAMALNSGGLVMLPHYLVDSNGPLQEVLTNLDIPLQEVNLVYPSNLRKSKRIQTLVEHLLAEGPAALASTQACSTIQSSQPIKKTA